MKRRGKSYDERGGRSPPRQRDADGRLVRLRNGRHGCRLRPGAGNFTQKMANIHIPAPNAPAQRVEPVETYTPAPAHAALPAPTHLPSLTPEASHLTPETITPARTPVVSAFGAFPTPILDNRSSIPQTTNPQTTAFQSANNQSPIQNRQSETANLMWGAAAAAAIGAATAYALEQRRKRKEEEARQAAEAAAEAARRNAAEEARKVQNYLQSTAMLNAAMQNSNLSESERAAVKEHAQRHGIGAALGLLGGMVTALQERKRDGKPNNPWRDVDPATADLTEAERLAQYKQSERYQAYQARMQAWQAEQERKRQAAALASFRAQERESVTLPPKEGPKPWWLSSSLEGTAKALAQTIPSARIGSWRNPTPAFSWVSPGHVISFGKVNSGMLASDANPNLTLNPDGSMTPSVGKQPIAALTSRPDGFDFILRNPWQRYAFAEGTVKATLSSSVTARVTWGGFWNTTVGVDVNYPEVQVSGAGLKGRVSEGWYVEYKPGRLVTYVLIAVPVVYYVLQTGDARILEPVLQP